MPRRAEDRTMTSRKRNGGVPGGVWSRNGGSSECFIETLAPRDLKRLGKAGPDSAPAVRTRTVTVGAKGPSPEAVRYRLDQGATQALGDEWRRWRRAGGGGRGRQAEAMVVGAIPPDTLRALRGQGVTSATATISIARRELQHLTRPDKQTRGQALTEADVDRLPETLAVPQAMFYEPGADGVLFVFAPADPAEQRKGKWFVQIDARVHERRGGGRRRPYDTHSIRSAGYVQAGDLRDPRYVPLTGEAE